MHTRDSGNDTPLGLNPARRDTINNTPGQREVAAGLFVGDFRHDENMVRIARAATDDCA